MRKVQTVKMDKKPNEKDDLLMEHEAEVVTDLISDIMN